MDQRSTGDAGISNLGMIVGMAALLGVLLIVAIVVSLTLPSSTTTTTTTATTGTAATGQPTTTSVTGTGTAAAVAACHADVSDVATALEAYQATKGSFPTPPAAWSAGTYPTNYAPLTAATAPGPFLKMPPGDNHYVVLWDSAGHVWVEPPGTFTPAYDAAADGTNPGTCTRVAH